MSDSKPYEIRASLLHLAKDILSENIHIQIQIARDNKQPLELASGYTTDNILEEAEKLYEFVSKR